MGTITIPSRDPKVDEVLRRRMRKQRPRAEKLRTALHRRFGTATRSEKLLREDRGR